MRNERSMRSGSRNSRYVVFLTWFWRNGLSRRVMLPSGRASARPAVPSGAYPLGSGVTAGLGGGLSLGGGPSAARACSAMRAPAPTPRAVRAWRRLRPRRGGGAGFWDFLGFWGFLSRWDSFAWWGSVVVWGAFSCGGSAACWGSFSCWGSAACWGSGAPPASFTSEILCPVTTPAEDRSSPYLSM